jgi:hypothetical protein
MIQRLFYELEDNPQRIFYESELLRRYPSEFHQWQQTGWVVRAPILAPGDYYAGNNDGLLLIVENEDGTLEGIDEYDPEFDPIPLAAQDLVGWKLDLHACAAEFQGASGLRGRPGPLDDRLFFLGEKLLEDSRIAVVLGLFGSDANALQNMRCVSNLLSDNYQCFVVVCPSYAPTPEASRQLNGLNVRVVQMQPAAPFVLDLETLPQSPRVRGPRTWLNEEEEMEFQRQRFNYRLPIYVTAQEKARNSTLVLLDGHELILPLAPFKLFIWILGGLFQDSSGFVAWDELTYSTGELREEHIVPTGIEQALNRLRTRFESPVGAGLKGTEFIEQRRRKVRVSTHKRYVTYDLQGLLTHNDEVIRLLAARLPDDPVHNVEAWVT